MPSVRIDSDKFLHIDAKRICIPNISFEEVIGTGGNAVVMLARHLYLDRPVAVKIWLSMREGDRRDKFEQGIAEAKKAANARLPQVVEIYDAGAVEGLFYAAMEYFPGITLQRWLGHHNPKLAIRWHLAQQLVDCVCDLASAGIIHGDLHWKNVLVAAPEAAPAVNSTREFAPDFCLIDFGTSRFSSPEFSTQRHWTVFTETFNRLLRPLDIEKICPAKKPRSLDPEDFWGWYSSFLREVPHMLASVGAGWVTTEVEPERQYADAIKEELRRLVAKQMLPLNASALGGFNEWWI
jgi:serine/threonine protein kinase